VHDTFSVETSPAIRKGQPFFDFDENYLSFRSCWGISMFKRDFRSILRAECSACYFRRRNKHCNAKNAMIRRFWQQIPVTSFLIMIFRLSEALFHPSYASNVVHATFSVERSPANRKTQLLVDFDKSNLLLLSWLWYFDFRTLFSTHFTRRM
jgi:hypothetical protein